MIAAAEDVEQTVVLPAVGNQQVNDNGSKIAAGWFQHYLHLVDRVFPRTLVTRDGRTVQFAACKFAVRPPIPDVMQPAWPYCPVCWPCRAGHWFVWKYLLHGVVPRCIRSGCDRDETDVRDPVTGGYLPCIGHDAAEN